MNRPQASTPKSFDLSDCYKSFKKRFVGNFQLVITFALLLCVFTLSASSTQAQSCTPSSTAQPGGHFTLTLLNATSGSGGQVTFSYKLRWDGLGNGMSHIVIGMCSDITQANLVSFSVTSTPSSGPWGCSSIAPQGDPCIQSDNPTGDFYGIKFSPLAPGASTVPANTDIFITFTLKPTPPTVNSITVSEQEWRLRAGLHVDSAPICGPDCSTGPTAVKMKKGSATQYSDGTIGIEWNTTYEARNLGFNIYRDEKGQLVKLNPELIAGSALLAGNATMAAGNNYVFWDKGASSATRYWIEDIDLENGSSWRGPFFLKSSTAAPPARVQSIMLSQLARTRSALEASKVVDTSSRTSALSAAHLELNDAKVAAGNIGTTNLASQQAVKISIRQTGWYRIALQDLIAAGLDPATNWRRLQLFTGSQEQPIAVQVNENGNNASYIEFYGQALNTPDTNLRIYWLVVGNASGLRIPQVKPLGLGALAKNFTQTIERRDRTIYFAGLLNGSAENFFGSIVLSTPVDQTLNLPHIDFTASGDATLEIALQGVTPQAHRINIELNGSPVGVLDFTATQQGSIQLGVPHALLREGINTVRLTAQNGSTDISLVDYIRLSYQHTLTADDNQLQLTANTGASLSIGGFTAPEIRVFDVTNPQDVQELIGRINETAPGSYAISLTTRGGGQRSLIAITDDKALSAVRLTANQVSNLQAATNTADFVIITTNELAGAMQPLKQARQAEGYRVMVIDIEDIYDEFNYGDKSLQAIQDFLFYAKSRWRVAPRFVLLAGGASYDRKNYLGFGNLDLIPTQSVNSTFLEGASDGWFADFNNDGVAEMAIGRLPVRSSTDAATIVSKILKYGQNRPADAAMLVSGRSEGYNFTEASATLKSVIPAGTAVQEISREELDLAAAKAQLLDGLSRGVKIFNYWGHGSVGLVQESLLTNADADNLRNESLPVMVMMTCLTGYFNDPQSESLSERWMKVSGGAIAVWSSSGMTIPTGQTPMAQEFYRLVLNKEQPMTLGEAVLRAKAVTSDADVRATWNFFGDPTLKLR